MKTQCTSSRHWAFLALAMLACNPSAAGQDSELAEEFAKRFQTDAATAESRV